MKLDTNGFTHINYPTNTREAVQSAAFAWKEFLELSEDIKDTFSADGVQLSVGYERKGDGSRGSADTKENFDITRQGIAELRQHKNSGRITPLLDTAEAMLDSLCPVAGNFCAQIESAYNLEGFSKTAEASAVNRFVRFLYYPPMPEGAVIGEAHTDHSGYTFHLYESTGGCHGLSIADGTTWFDMPVEGDQMAAFGGMQLQLVSEGRIKALSHEITANETSSSLGRYAIVCFNVLDGVPSYDRATYGRLQEQKPGFNYAMTHEQFSKLFK